VGSFAVFPYIAAETGYLLALADRDPRIAGVVASGRPEANEFAKYLDEIAGHSKLKGIRRVLDSQPDDLAQSALFAESIRRLEQYRLSFDLRVLDHQLPVAIGLVKACPAVSFILDHCGCPQPKGKGFDCGVKGLSRSPALPTSPARYRGWSVIPGTMIGRWKMYACGSTGWFTALAGTGWCLAATGPFAQSRRALENGSM
jgi:predicted TIM-barrel fold metal-dependent hydrolase